MQDYDDEYKPYLEPRGRTEDRFAEIKDPRKVYDDLKSLCASMPKPKFGEPADLWWSRVLAEKAAAAQTTDERASKVVALSEWQARRTSPPAKMKTECILLAAAPLALQKKPLPQKALQTRDGLVNIMFHEEPENLIRIELETSNIRALDLYMSGQALMLSLGNPKGTAVMIDTVFRFDDDGFAELTVPDTAEIRNRLDQITIYEI